MTELPRCVTVKQVCERLGVGKTLVYRLIGEGAIPSIRLGGRVLVPVDGLAELLGRKPTSAEEQPARPEEPPRDRQPPRAKLRLW